jgi:sugar (pentulose or hexulose) kinase
MAAMTDAYVMGIDSGTQSVRVMIFDQHGTVVSAASAQHEPYNSPQPGWAEQHSEDIWDKLCRATRQAMKGLPGSVDHLLAAGLSTQRNTFVFADAEGRVLRPLILWLDERLTFDVEPDPGWPDWLQEFQLISKANWVKHNEPDIHKKVRRILTVSAWLTHLLTGHFRDSLAMHVGHWPFDVDELAFSSGDAMYDALGMPREYLAELFSPATVLGTVTAEAASRTGLPEGLPIVSAAGDKQCETLGAGAIVRGRAAVTYGTLAGLSNTVYEPLHALDHEYELFPSAVPGAWNPEFRLIRGYWLVTWFREQFCHDLAVRADESLASIEELMNEEAADIPPGSEGLVVAPWWFPDLWMSGAKGVILGLDGVHTRAHLFRALLEGIALGLRPGLEFFDRDQGVQIEEVVVGGGGARSDMAMQITADVFGVPAGRPRTIETCSLGCAMDAAVACGLYRDCPEAVDHMTQIERTFDPIEKNRQLYDAIYDDVFSPLYETLLPLFEKLAMIRSHQPRRIESDDDVEP